MKLKAKIQIGSTPLYDMNLTVIKKVYNIFFNFKTLAYNLLFSNIRLFFKKFIKENLAQIIRK
jgi:hypothetical protein